METLKKVVNVYQEKPEVDYKRTSVPMADVISYLQHHPYPLRSVIRSAYVLFRNESGNGKSGVNNNYAGVQADGRRWADKWNDKIVATCVKAENMTGKARRFVCFDSWETSLDFLIDRVVARGLYCGGYAHYIAKAAVTDYKHLAAVYYKEWVMGDINAEPSAEFVSGFKSMYEQALKLFP